MRRVPRRFYNLAFAFLMSSIMSCLVALIVSLRTLGFSTDVFTVWLSGWAAALPVAFPVTVVVVPLVRWMLGRVVAEEQ